MSTQLEVSARDAGADGAKPRGAGPGGRPGRAAGLRNWMAHHWGDRPLWMLIPAGAALLIIVIIPVCLTVVLSLLNVNVSTLREWLGAPFYGIQNYVNAFTAPSTLGVSLGRSILISFTFSILTTVVITPIGMVAAFSVHRRFKFSGLMRAIYLIPYVIPTFVTALMARIVFLNGTGLFDKALKFFHITNGNTYWLIGSNSYWAMQITEIWATWPFIYLMVLAGLQAIPKEHYEAAALDGASIRQRLRHIVIPELSGVLKLGMLLSTLFHFGNFTLAFVMFSSPPPAAVEVLPITAYYNAFDFFNFGVASAIAVVTMVILIVPGYIYLRSTRLAAQAN
ncbi:MAG: sugar ABC transporter permease [Actinomycetota bacterium]|jgi:multiple sugar transport system permease protein|nr:sugar ABC transporter permease [Actinomycetota bacterium]